MTSRNRRGRPFLRRSWPARALTAKALGLAVPLIMQMTADEVIEQRYYFAAIAHSRLWHKADLPKRLSICPLSDVGSTDRRNIF
jgi:hypothetical protein